MRLYFEWDDEMEVSQRKIVEVKKSECVNALNEVKFLCKELTLFPRWRRHFDRRM